jgi:antitoxin ParD1/3/4
MTTVTISLPDSLMQFVDTQVTNKGYGDVREYICSLLYDAQEQEEDARMEALVLEGASSGDPIPLDESFWNELRKELEQRVGVRKA